MDFVTKHAKNKKDNSSIIFKSVIAKEAKTKDKSVINATIGMLYDENEEFYMCTGFGRFKACSCGII